MAFGSGLRKKNVGWFEDGNENSGSITLRDFVDQLRNCYLIKKDFFLFLLSLQVLPAEELERWLRVANEHDSSIGYQYQLMKHVEYLCRRLVYGAEQGTTFRRYLPHRPHQSACREWVQSRRGLVTEQQRRVGQQLDTVRSVTSEVTVLSVCRNILHWDKFPEDRSGSFLHAVSNNLQQCSAFFLGISPVSEC